MIQKAIQDKIKLVPSAAGLPVPSKVELLKLLSESQVLTFFLLDSIYKLFSWERRYNVKIWNPQE